MKVNGEDGYFWPDHKCGLYLTHNEHKDYHQSVSEWDCENEQYHWVSEDEKQKAIEANELWTLQWYPETPIGSYSLCASDLRALLAVAVQVGKK